MGHGEGKAGKDDGEPLPPRVEEETHQEKLIQKSKVLNFSRRDSVAKLLAYGEFKKYRHTQLYFGGHSTFSYTKFA